jgi:hypothetical protein
MADDQNKGWKGDSDEHAQAGSQSSGNSNAAQNLSDEDRSKGGKASHESGNAHEWDSDEAQKAGNEGGSH